MALRGQNILLTPDNLNLPKQGLRELKQMLTKSNGVLYEDKFIVIELKSETKIGMGRAALRLTSKLGPITNFTCKIINDGGLKFSLANPVLKESQVDLLLTYQNVDIITAFPELQFFFS